VGEAAEEPSLIGSVLASRFRLLEVIGEGGMGRVYRAEELGPGRQVAVKLLHSEAAGVDQMVQRFEREASVMKELSHPNIARVATTASASFRLRAFTAPPSLACELRYCSRFGLASRAWYARGIRLSKSAERG